MYNRHEPLKLSTKYQDAVIERACSVTLAEFLDHSGSQFSYLQRERPSED